MKSATFQGGAPRGVSSRLAVLMVLGSAAAVAACSSNNDNTTPPAASAIGVVSGNAQISTAGAAGLAQPMVVIVTDQNGNPISAVTVSFTATGGATLTTPSATTSSSGTATDSVTLIGNTTGTDTVTASVSGVSTSATFTYTVQAGAAAAIAVVSGNNQTGAISTAIAAPMVVTVTDAHGNPVANATVDWTVTAGLLSGTASTVTDVTGSTQNGLTFPAVTGAVTVTATVHGTAASTTFTETAM
ncbi:MAG TPA: Ig-like domain-containing protein [Gemmatimonadales bacterium]